MAELQFQGTWDASLGAFPTVATGLNNLYYLVSAAGEVNGYSFDYGDWLIYIKEGSSEKWYKTSGGILQVNVGESLSPSVADPGVYTKITVDASGNVVDGDILEGSDIPSHEQSAETITDLESAARKAVGPMFVNTPNSKAVVFNFDTVTNTVSADVKYDNQTIVKNQYGQLSAVAMEIKPHTHNVSDIKGLATGLLAAEDQTLSKSAYIGNTISETFDDIASLLDKASETFSKLLPEKPLKVSEVSLSLRNTTPYTAKALTDEVCSPVVDITTPQVGTPLSPDDITGLFYNGDLGKLSARIDDEMVGEVELSEENDIGTYDALTVEADIDPYLGETGKEGFYKGLRASITPPADLTEGLHLFSLSHDEDTAEMKVHVDNPASSEMITIEGASLASSHNKTAKWLSGVPSISNTDPIIISGFTVKNAVSQYYNASYVAQIISPCISTVYKQVVTHDQPSKGSYGDAIVDGSVITLPENIVDDSISFSIEGLNSKGTLGVPFVLNTGLRVDATTESERIFSGDPTLLFPVLDDEVFDSSKSLVEEEYTGELQKKGITTNLSQYMWPAGDYTSFTEEAPDYTDAPGAEIPELDGEWRWATFKLPNELSNKTSCIINLDRATGVFSTNINKETSNLLIYAKVAGPLETGWLNCNKAYPGIGTPDEDGDAAMLSGDEATTGISKKITFGSVSRSGDLYIRVAIKKDSGLAFAGISIAY